MHWMKVWTNSLYVRGMTPVTSSVYSYVRGITHDIISIIHVIGMTAVTSLVYSYARGITHDIINIQHERNDPCDIISIHMWLEWLLWHHQYSYVRGMNPVTSSVFICERNYPSFDIISIHMWKEWSLWHHHYSYNFEMLPGNPKIILLIYVFLMCQCSVIGSLSLHVKTLHVQPLI